MGYDEYYKGNEYKGANEHVRFKVEFASNNEVVFLNENKQVKEDNTSLRKNQSTETGKYKKKNNNKDTNTNHNDVTNTNTVTTQSATTSVVTTTSAVTAGAIAVAAISIALAAPPLIEILKFNVGGDYLEYQIETNDFVDGIDYFVEIDDGLDYHYKKQIEDVGLYEEIVNNLVPNTNYTYKFIGYDSTLESKVYLEKYFTTEFNYLATYNKYNLDQCKIIWTYQYDEVSDEYNEIYRIIIPTKFKNDTENNYQYRITLFNDEGLNQTYQGTAPEVIFNIPRTYKTATIKYESIIINNDVEQVCDTLIHDNYIFKESFKVNDFYLDYQNNSAIVDIELNAPETYGLRYYTSINSEPQEIYASDTTYLDYPEGETTYYFYMVDEEGNTISEIEEYTANTIDEVPYIFNYKNPGEITITYNDNGTVNAYFDTNFSCDDKDVYYEVTLIDYDYGNIKYISQSRYAALEEYMDYSGKSISFKVFKEVDNIKHCFMSVTPSGTLEPNNTMMNYEYLFDSESDPPLFHFNGYNNFKLDTSSAYFVINDEVINVDSELFVIDEYNDYSLIYELPSNTTNGKFIFMGAPFYNEYDTLKEVEELNMIGNCYRKMIIEFEKEI